MKKCMRLFLALLLLTASLLTACGKADDPFQVIFASPFVNEELAAEFDLPLTGGIPVQYSGFSFGSESVDPMTYGASAMMMSAMVAAGEVDVLVCDLGEAARYGRGGTFCELGDLFPPEELAQYEEKFVTFDEVDDYGVLTGEKTAPLGIELTGKQDLDYILGGGTYGVFIVAGTGDVDAAKEVFRQLIQY